MIHWKKGDIFKSMAQVLVNPVNCVGTCGKGLAKEFAHRYPTATKFYKRYAKQGYILPGDVSLWVGDPDVDCGARRCGVLHFATKNHWRDPSDLQWVVRGLREFRGNVGRWLNDWGIQSYAFPKLGCGNGGLDWDDVRPIMQMHLESLPVEVEVYE